MVNQDYLRNIVFGFEDGFVSSVGTLVGIAAANPDPNFVIVTGMIIVSVESFSMGVGGYLSEKSVHEISTKGHRDKLLLDGLLMWVSYLTAGLIVLTPFILITPPTTAALVAVTLTLLGLFTLGFFKAKATHRTPVKSGLEMLLVAGGAIAIGYVIGKVGQSLLLQ